MNSALRSARLRGGALLTALALVLLTGCGSSFSDAQVGDGERLVSTDLYAVVVPEGAEQSGADGDVAAPEA